MKSIAIRGTRHYGSPTNTRHEPNHITTCPFCGATTHTEGPHIAHHKELLGFTLCPASGRTAKETASLAASLADNYLLPDEGSPASHDT